MSIEGLNQLRLFLSGIIALEFLYFLTQGHLLSKRSCPGGKPILFLRRLNGHTWVLPRHVHNGLIALLPLLALAVLLFPLEFSALPLFLSSVVIFYATSFSFLNWHHSHFLTACLTFMTAMLVYSLRFDPEFSSAFRQLPLLQVALVYIVAGLWKATPRGIHAPMLFNAIFTRIRKHLPSRKPTFESLNLSVAALEVAMGILVLVPFAAFAVAACTVCIPLHMGTLLATGRGHGFHSLMPAVLFLRMEEVQMVSPSLATVITCAIWLMLLLTFLLHFVYFPYVIKRSGLQGLWKLWQ